MEPCGSPNNKGAAEESDQKMLAHIILSDTMRTSQVCNSFPNLLKYVLIFHIPFGKFFKPSKISDIDNPLKSSGKAAAGFVEI